MPVNSKRAALSLLNLLKHAPKAEDLPEGLRAVCAPLVGAFEAMPNSDVRKAIRKLTLQVANLQRKDAGLAEIPEDLTAANRELNLRYRGPKAQLIEAELAAVRDKKGGGGNG